MTPEVFSEAARALELLPRWVLYLAGLAHGVLVALYLPGAVAWCVRTALAALRR